ncbi:MAG: hypothetical protein HC880_14765 [Bacteroidia bacterium]|nr:hypothetical protein [Bacteroidia bacterium]
MKKQLMSFFYGRFLALLASSCVSAKKYKQLEAQYQKANISERSNENQVESLRRENEMLRNELRNIRSANAQIKDETRLRGSVNAQETDEWRQRYEELLQEYQRLQYNSSLEAQYQRSQLQNQAAN